MDYLVTLPNFIIYFGVSTLAMAIFMVVYTTITPYNEFALIRESNFAAARGLSGAMIGYALPLASLSMHATNLVDFAIWATIAAVVQIFAYLVVAVPYGWSDAKTAIERHDNEALGLLFGVVAVVAGIANATSLSY